jgi:hypothetical protein
MASVFERRPIEFLKQLQAAVKSSITPPLSADDAQLAARFDAAFGNGEFASKAERALFVAGAQAAHELIIERYRTSRGPTGWVHFTNIGAWGGRGHRSSRRSRSSSNTGTRARRRRITTRSTTAEAARSTAAVATRTR